MTELDFLGNPGAWPLLAAAPVAWLLLRAADRRRSRRLLESVGPRAPLLAHRTSARSQVGRRALLATGVFLAALAALEPSWGAPVAVEPRGVDLMVCLDVSRSMLARDAAPTRLDRAKQEIRALSLRTRGDRLGLVVFSGETRLLVPLTRDMKAFADLSATAGIDSVMRGGTELGAPLDAALAALSGATGDHEAIILLTDGADGAPDVGERAMRAAERCRDRGIAVHCIGLGSARGSKIAVSADDSRPGSSSGETFLRDRAGREIVSALDATLLRRIAVTTVGTFVDGNSAVAPAVGLYERRVLPMARDAVDERARRERPSRFQWPLAAAFVLWSLALALGDSRHIDHASARRP